MSGAQDLGHLADEEDELGRLVEAITGSIEERDRSLQTSGLPERYVQVFSGYMRLAGPPVLDIEALKRVLFLAWYSNTEPAWLSGLPDLGPALRDHLESLLSSWADAADDELRAMLGGYRHFADYGLPFETSPVLDALAPRRGRAGPVGGGINLAGWQHRGLMGRYWKSVLDAETLARPRQENPEAGAGS